MGLGLTVTQIEAQVRMAIAQIEQERGEEEATRS